MQTDPKLLGKITTIETTYEGLRYQAIAALEMEIAQTREHFRGIPPSTRELDWKPIHEGDRWGDDWLSAWFRGSVTMPSELDGQSAFLRAQTDGRETLLLVDGRHRGVFDANHPVRLLTLKATRGTTHCIHLESYAGHTFPGTQPFDESIATAGGAPQDGGFLVTPNSRIFQKVELVSERTDVSAFVFELRALRQLVERLDEHSLRRGRIQRALERVFTLVYAKPEEIAEEKWRPLLNQARTVMGPLLEQKNGPTMPHMGIVGHSHIDTAWLWPLAETWRKLARTFSSVLSLMEQYPEFRFTQSAALHADAMRRLYPAIFAQIQQRVQEGRWEVNGAMWIEPDCNIPSGESFVRQCLVGQSATREMFGVTSDTLWQPDVFGYSAALPQILRGSGVKYFCTTKLGWNDTNKFPCDTFTWQGMDGSSVLTHFNRIHCWPDPDTLIDAWNQVQHKDVQDRRLIAFGYGDGGGGPMAEMIEMARLVEDLEGCPRAGYTSISEFMTGCEKELTDLPRWVGELYLELHRGTLTSVAGIKRANRKCEFALREAEFAATLATIRKNTPYPAEPLLEAWKKLLLNQFHDILPGSSIAEVNDEAMVTFEECHREATSLRDEALRSLTTIAHGDAQGDGILLSNSLSWERSGEMEILGLPEGTIPTGEDIVAQEFEDLDAQKRLVVTGLSIPSMGYRTVPLTRRDENRSSAKPSPFRFEKAIVETPFARVTFNNVGQIVSFFDKGARRELVTAGGSFNTFLLGEDVPAAWDNWDIDRDQRLKLVAQDHLVERTVASNGPLQLRLRQKYEIGEGSELIQEIVFHSTTPRVDFETIVHWREKYQFLKTAFNVDVLADSARHEIQFGHVTRSTHDNTSYDRAQFDVCAHKWTDLSEGSFGVTFLNDSKYACTIRGSEYQLSLLKSGRHPDARGDEGKHTFVYAFLPHRGGFSVESVVRPAYELNLPPSVVRASVAQASLDKSQLFSLMHVDASNVLVEAIKGADGGDGFIVRLYEADKTGTHATLTFGIPVLSVTETNLLEEGTQEVLVSDNRIEVYLRPFEIKTLKVRLPKLFTDAMKSF